MTSIYAYLDRLVSTGRSLDKIRTVNLPQLSKYARPIDINRIFALWCKERGHSE